MNSGSGRCDVRPAMRDDWGFIRELCCRTGNAGDPIDPARWPFFSEQWVGPYERLLPEWGYVAHRTGARLGYLTGCPDSRAFEVKRMLWFEVPLVLRLKLLNVYPKTSETKRFIRRALRWERGPEQAFPATFLKDLKESFPAHLHMNVESFARGTGAGRALVDRFRKDLFVHGIKGVHLFCGDRPLEFYRKTGFQVLNTLEFRPGVKVHALGSHF